MSLTPENWVPRSCTLPTIERPLRLAEFDELLAHARQVRTIDQTTIIVTLTAGSTIAQTARDLAQRESECCSFFRFTITETPSKSTDLQIQVPPEHVDVLRALATRAATLGTC